jgi:hypothetical protein
MFWWTMLDIPNRARPADPSFTLSTLRESIVEQLFIGDMLRNMWCGGVRNIEVLHPAVDAHGYDLVISAKGITRHIQLKTVGKTAKNARFKVHKLLAEKENGCVIVVTVDSDSLELGPYLFFGNDPGVPLPMICHYPIAKHTKGDSNGFKAPRDNHRVVPKANFRTLDCIGEVVQALFGSCSKSVVGAEVANPAIVDKILSYLPRQQIIDALARAAGNELDGKFASEESSAALAANTFGYFLDKPGMLPPIPNTSDLGWPARCVQIEACVRFPWAGGMHPWLDALIETDSHLIGVESKRYEPFRSHPAATFSGAYGRKVWGDDMKPYENMRDRLGEGGMQFERLNAVQLVKHAFGLRTEAHRRGKAATLVYLYAEPEAWSNGECVSTDALEMHAQEARRFASQVEGAEVKFRLCTYKEMLSAFRATGDRDLSRHADTIALQFRP